MMASRSTLKRMNRAKLVFLLALLLLSFLLILLVDNLMVSMLVAFVISYTVGPLVNYLERQGVSRLLATSAVFVMTGGTLVFIGFMVAPSIGSTLSSLQADLPRLISGIGDFISEVESKIRGIAGPLASFDVTGKVEGQLTQWTHDTFDRLPGMVRTFLTVAMLGPFLAFFMVKDGRQVINSLLGLVPNQLFEPALSLIHQINFQIGQFVRARILESVIVGIVTTVGLFAIGFPYALLLGFLSGATNLIPYLGPIIGAVPAFLIALVNHQSHLTIFLVAIVYIVAQLIDAGVLIPLMVARIVDLHPVTVILVMIAGAQMMGIIGMIISIPVASTLKVTLGTVYRHLVDSRA